MRVKETLLAALLTAFSLVSFATDYYLATTDLNARAGAGTVYSVSFTILEGEEVELISRSGPWYRVRYQKKTGYVFSKYLEYSRSASETGSSIPPNWPKTVIGIILGVILLPFVFILFRKVQDKRLLNSVTGSHRGTRSERDLVLRLRKFGVPPQNIFHDLYLKTSIDTFSQIDLVVISQVGIIVFEVKEYNGWLFGSGSQSQWTQVLAYGRQKHRFYNPILQNKRHISELESRLHLLENIPIFSVVVFYGNCELKEIDFVPRGTFLVKADRVLDALRIILKENKPVHYYNADNIVRVLKQAVKNGASREIQHRHSENIKDMLGKDRILD